MAEGLDRRRGLAGLGVIDIADREIRQLLEYGVAVANKLIDFCEVRKRLGIPEDRTLKLKITDVEGEAGFIIIGCEVRPLSGIEKATVTVETTKDVFWALVAGKMTVYQAWLYDLVRFKGEHSLRDAQLLIPLFETIREYVLGGGGR